MTAVRRHDERTDVADAARRPNGERLQDVADVLAQMATEPRWRFLQPVLAPAAPPRVLRLA